MTCIPSDLALEAADAFRKLVGRHVDCGNWRVHLEADYSDLREQLVNGEWHRIGVRSEDTGAAPSLHDSTVIAEVWGSVLAPLPLIPAIVLQARFPAVAAANPRLLFTCALSARDGGSLIPYYLPGCAVMVSDGRLVDAPAGAEVGLERSDPLMPVGRSRLPGLDDSAVANDLYALFAAEAIGCAGECLRRALAWAGERKAFGKTIVLFQAVRHRLADMYKDVEIARGALALAIAEPWRAQDAAAFVFERCRSVIEGAIQVHGGHGFTWDAGLHFYLRRVMALGDLVAETLPAGGAAFQHVG